jgi:hypothetical protein
MSTQYVLAKRDYFNSLLHGRAEQPAATPLDAVAAVTRTLATPDEKLLETAADITALLPKTYRSRASALLKMLGSHLRIGDSNMIVFRHAKQEFENLYDLLFWLFTSTNIARVQRPTNAFDFIQALVELKIPQRLLSTKEKYVRKVQRSLKKYRGKK